MAYRFTFNDRESDSARLTAEAVILYAGTDRAEPAVAVRISGAPSRLIYVPLDRLEELVTGLRETARQAAADFGQGQRSV